jgi:hypothetical protein
MYNFADQKKTADREPETYWWSIKYCLDILKSDILLLFVLCWFVALPEPFIFVDLCCSETLLHPQTIMFKTEFQKVLKSEENTYLFFKSLTLYI